MAQAQVVSYVLLYCAYLPKALWNIISSRIQGENSLLLMNTRSQSSHLNPIPIPGRDGRKGIFFNVAEAVGPFRRHPRRGTPHQGHPAVPRRKPRGDPGNQDQDSPRLRALLHAKSPSRSGERPTRWTSTLATQKTENISSYQKSNSNILFIRF